MIESSYPSSTRHEIIRLLDKYIIMTLSELLKFIKGLKAKGFATADEKTKVKEAIEELGEDAEVIEDQAEEVAELPEEDATEDDVVKSLLNRVKSQTGDMVSSEVSKMKAEIEKEVKDFVAKQKELAEKKAGNFAKGTEEKRKAHSEYIRNLSKSLLANDYATVKEMTSGNAGQNIIDDELSAEIRHLMTEFGVARREFFVTPLSQNSYSANALLTDVAVSWTGEGDVIPTVSLTVNQEELKLKKLSAIAVMTRELIEDQEIDLFAFIASRVAEGFAKAEDKAFFTGEGTGDTTNGEFTGLLSETLETVEVANVAGITPEKLTALIDALPEGAHSNAKFYMHRSVLSAISLLKDGDGRYIYQNPLDTGKIGQIKGYPVVTVEVMPTATDTLAAEDGILLFGDLRKSSILGFKGGISMDRFNAGVVRNQANDGDVNLITTDREAIRWVQRTGALTILPDAVAKLAVEATS